MQQQVGSQTLTPPVHGHHIRVIPTADADIELPVVRHNNRFHRQTVRSDRSNDDSPALRYHQRTTDRQVISRTAGRCSNDQSVRVIGVQQLAVDAQFNLQHTTQTLLKDGNFVQCIRRHNESISLIASFVRHSQSEQATLLNRIFACHQLAQDIIHVICRYLCEETQMPAVDA